MKRNISALFAIAAICAITAVSCGNDETKESSINLELPVVTNQTEESGASEVSTETSTETTEKTNNKKEKTSETSITSKTSTETETTANESSETTMAENEDGVPADVPPEAITDSPADEPQTEPPTEAPTDPPASQTVQFSMDNLNSDASEIISALGDALDVQYAQGCLSNGADQKIYFYDGLTLNCYVIDGAEYIYQIEIKNSNYSTSTGITIGSSKADAESAYGAGEESGGYVIYHNGDSELDIEYDGDTVKSIIFYIPV